MKNPSFANADEGFYFFIEDGYQLECWS